MSAFLALSTPASVTVYADALKTALDGTVTGSASKIAVKPAGCIITGLGRYEILHNFAVMAQRKADGFDALRDRYQEILAEALAPLDGPRGVDLFIAGWSAKRGRLEAWCATDDSPLGLAPAVYSPGFPLHAEPGEFSDADAIAHFERIRHVATEEYRDGEWVPFEYVGIGGFLQKAIVTEAGTSHAIIHTWPDRPGEKIRRKAA